MITEPAPIALFVHSRLDHTQQTVAALQANYLAIKSPLYIFSDGPRESVKGEVEAVKAVRKYLKSINGFLTVEIIERPVNWGLKRNIIFGLNDITAEYDSVIVVEDDCVTAPDFLHYMNCNLFNYRNDSSIWHISGWSPGISGDKDIYRSQFMSCWGWATWSEYWNKTDLDAWSLLEKMSVMARYRFNLDNAFPFYSHLLGNYLGVNKTWAIFWAASIFVNGGKCISPVESRVRNVGMDGSGSHDVSRFEQCACRDRSGDKSSYIEGNSLDFKPQLRKFLLKTLSFKQRVAMWGKILFPLIFVKLYWRMKARSI